MWPHVRTAVLRTAFQESCDERKGKVQGDNVCALPNSRLSSDVLFPKTDPNQPKHRRGSPTFPGAPAHLERLKLHTQKQVSSQNEPSGKS